MSAHTPGPWTLDDQIDTVTILGADESPVCVVEVGEGPDEGVAAEADINLIAAAPDLLAACDAALATLDLRGDRAQLTTAAVLRAAIKKARGK